MRGSAILLALALVPQASRAATVPVLYSNLLTEAVGIRCNDWRTTTSGQPALTADFTASASGPITTIQLPLRMATPAPVTIRVRKDREGRPGPLIAAAELSGITTSPRLLRATLPPGRELQQASRYWIELAAPPDSALAWALSSQGADSPAFRVFSASRELASTFGPGPGLLGCEAVETDHVATSFTPAASGHLSYVEMGLAASNETPPSSLLIEIAEDESGHPGAVIDTMTLQYELAPGRLAVIHSRAQPNLNPQRRYWVIARPAEESGSPARWLTNGAVTQGAVLRRSGDSWSPVTLPPPAFRVVANTNPDGPQLNDDGIRNAASLQPGPICPGEMLLLTGTGFGPGTRVWFDDTAIAVSQANAGRLVTTAPNEIDGKSTVNISVEYKGQRGPPVTVAVESAVPAVFTTGATGQGEAIAFNEDGSRNSAANPALRGTALAIQMTGLGTADPPLAVLFGRSESELYTMRPAPGFTGVTEVRVQIPADAPTGQVPLRIRAVAPISQAGVTVSLR